MRAHLLAGRTVSLLFAVVIASTTCYFLCGTTFRFAIAGAARPFSAGVLFSRSSVQAHSLCEPTLRGAAAHPTPQSRVLSYRSANSRRLPATARRVHDPVGNLHRIAKLITTVQHIIRPSKPHQPVALLRVRKSEETILQELGEHLSSGNRERGMTGKAD